MTWQRQIEKETGERRWRWTAHTLRKAGNKTSTDRHSNGVLQEQEVREGHYIPWKKYIPRVGNS